MTTKRYLVTGGCGFIGARLVAGLRAEGHQVVVLDDLSRGDPAQLATGVQIIEACVTDALSSRQALGDLDGIFHLAARVSVEAAQGDPETTRRTNVQGTRQIFELASRARPHPLPVVFASSAAVYGNARHLPLDEAHPKAPIGSYGTSKLEAEGVAADAFLEAEVSSVGLRLFNVYGPWAQSAAAPPGVIATFCRQLAAGEPLVIHGNGQQRRDFLYLDDAVTLLFRAMALAGRRPRHQVVNGCTGVGTSLLQLAEMLAAQACRPVSWRHAAPRPADIAHSVGCPAEMGRLLRWFPGTALASGLARTLHHVLPEDAAAPQL